MKTFILENIYMSDMSAPSVYSTDRFPTFESAIEEAYKQFKEEAKKNPQSAIKVLFEEVGEKMFFFFFFSCPKSERRYCLKGNHQVQEHVCFWAIVSYCGSLFLI